LVEHDHAVTVVLPDRLERPAAAFRQLGVQTHPLPLSKVVWNREVVQAVSQLIREAGFDVVHVHSQEAGIPARPVARLAGAKKVFYTPQTIDIRRTRWHWLYALAERGLATLTGVIISVNDSDRMRLIGWGIPAHKVVTVPNGIELAGLGGPANAAAIREGLGLDREQPLVMQVGRLSAQKNPVAFVEGAARAVERVPTAQFALIGEGPLAEEVEARAGELGLTGRVHLLGWRANASQLMAAADVVTLTSRWEGTPYALLEAMAWSKPVVAMAVNGCPEVVVDGETGLLAAPDDVAAWSQKLVALLVDPEAAAQMGLAGRMRVEKEFTLQRMVSRIERLYEQALGG
jgi:glycosyltransferase involved in cell wall biosynthesis